VISSLLACFAQRFDQRQLQLLNAREDCQTMNRNVKKLKRRMLFSRMGKGTLTDMEFEIDLVFENVPSYSRQW